MAKAKVKRKKNSDRPSAKGKRGGWANGKSPSGFEAASHTYANTMPPFGEPDERRA